MRPTLNLRWTLPHACVAFGLSAALAFAGESAASLTAAGIPENCANFAAKVSASEGNFGSTNSHDCVGAFQFCHGTFERYYSGDTQSFLSDPQAQVAAWTRYEQASWAEAQRNGLTSLIGQQVCSGSSCATVDQSAILMACQFGCAKGGKLANYVASGDCNARNVKDGNGVSVCTYLVRGAGYDASCFTGQPSTVCLQTPSGPGDFENGLAVSEHAPDASDAHVVVGSAEI